MTVDCMAVEIARRAFGPASSGEDGWRPRADAPRTGRYAKR
jgi:hypothetical protein